MKAVQINSYGGTEVLEINTSVPRPQPKEGQVLVEVWAASINPIDWKIRVGFLKDMAPLPFPITLGGDFAGIVAEAAPSVSDFTVGDEVYGNAIVLGGGSGSFAEFVTVKRGNAAKKPGKTNFIEAASLPLAGVSALQAIEEHITLSKEQKILIHGGAGGIGSLAIQIAKAKGAYVATTVGPDDVEYVKSLDADEVVDYKNQDFSEILKDFDAVYDTVGGETTMKSFQVLKRGGILVSMLGQPDEKLAKQYVITAIGQNTRTTTQHLNRLAELVESGQVKPQVAKVFTLDQVKEAMKYQETGHPRGKVVLKIRG